MKPDVPHILFVNPWIHDFAAYDFWAKPLGLLNLAAILRAHGYTVHYIDCLDRFHPSGGSAPARTPDGRGPYLKTRIPTPKGLQDVARRYSRYGIKPEWLKADLKQIPRPDLILVTSLMTYWYPGLQETIRCLKTVFPRTPIVLGGIYATLCHAHALTASGADHVVVGQAETGLLDLVAGFIGASAPGSNPGFDPQNLDTYPYPALDLQRKIAYIPLLTSKGCPFRCAYCASYRLQPKQQHRSPAGIMEEIRFWHKKYGVCDFALYDDAFLFQAEIHALPLLEAIVQSGLKLRFHTPNALHIRWISNKTARLMFKAGFQTVRLGLETGSFENRKEIDQKVDQGEFLGAVAALMGAGFTRKQLGAYLLVGLPGQPDPDIDASIRFVKKSGITPVIAYYSPLPHTPLWDAAVAASRYDLASDPLFCNNAVMPCQKEPFNWQRISRLKKLASGAVRLSEGQPV